MVKFIYLVLLLLQVSACSRSYMVKSESTTSNVEQVNVLAVAYRRPDYEPAEQEDFKFNNRELECQFSDELWKDILKDQVAVRGCLNSLEEVNATYFYTPETKPYLEIDEKEESNPKCLKAVLSKIPLPREIYYLGKQEGKTADEDPQVCYASSFSIKTNRLFQSPVKFLKKKIVIPFPLDRTLESAHDLSLWLMVSTFTILKSDEQAGGQLLATPVPDSVCNQCFKHDALFKDKYSGKLKPVFWP